MRGGRTVEDEVVLNMECFDPATQTWSVVLRVDRGTLPNDMSSTSKRTQRDASIVDALITDFEQKGLFDAHANSLQGQDGDAQRVMHLAGFL